MIKDIQTAVRVQLTRHSDILYSAEHFSNEIFPDVDNALAPALKLAADVVRGQYAQFLTEQRDAPTMNYSVAPLVISVSFKSRELEP